MDKTLLLPPLAFVIVFLVVWLFSLLLSKCAYPTTKQSEGSKKTYACGEEFDDTLIAPDYSQFFPFAFFFTILHVVALAVATVPVGTEGNLAMAVVYVLGAMIGLVILLRK